MEQKREVKQKGEKFSLANRRHLSLVMLLLMRSGSLCDKCGHGTRVTSKNWAKCKQCGERVKRVPIDAVGADIKSKLEAKR